MAASLTTPEYLKWSMIPITFDRSDHPDYVPTPGRYPLIVCPIIKDVKLNRVFIDEGSSLNILFLNTFDQMGLSRSSLCPSQAPFHGIVPGVAATHVSQISLPVTFRTQENFHTETIQFEVTNFKTVYTAFLGRLALSKFMAIPHYAYLFLKMSVPCGVISIRGDVKRAFDCDRENCEIADRLTLSAELQELKQAWPSPPRPDHAQGQDLQDIHPTGGHTQQDDLIVHGGAFQDCSRGQQFGSQTGTHARQIPPRK
jgi:hypothetical protein